MTQPHRTPKARPSFPPAILVAALLGLAAGACTAVKKEASVEFAPQACCTEADAELQHFKGCRLPRRNCHKEEKWWMRGHVTCGPVDEASCAGGRCCEYKAQYDPSVGKPAEEAADSGGSDSGDADDATDEVEAADDAAKAEDGEPATEDADGDVPDPVAEDDAPPEADGDDPQAPLP